jgi:hypothetical protein
MADVKRWFPWAELTGIMPRAAVEALRQTHSTADTKIPGVSTSVRSDAAGVFDAYTEDLIVRVYENNIEIANRTIRGVLDTGTGEFTLTSPAVNTGLTKGEETTVAYYGTTASNVGDSVRADVTHTRSRMTGAAAFSAVDNSVAGATPGTITEGGGGGDFGGGGGGMKRQVYENIRDFVLKGMPGLRTVDGGFLVETSPFDPFQALHLWLSRLERKKRR